MKLSLTELIERKEYLQAILEKLPAEIGHDAVEGNIRVIKHHNGYQYFLRQDKRDKSGKYIRNKDLDIAKEILQNKYDVIIKTKAEQELRHIAALEKIYKDGAMEDAYSKMHPGKCMLIEPIEVPDQIFFDRWYNEKYAALDFREGAPEFYTNAGIRVRSKSELIIGNCLEQYNIAYRYEKPLRLKDSAAMVHPDFSILDLKRRQEIYWEHLGMMDEIDYRNNALLKIRNYELSGIFVGERLILTMETLKNPIDIRQLHTCIKHLKYRLDN